MKTLTAPEQGLLASVQSLTKTSKPWFREFDPPEVAIAKQNPDMSVKDALFFALNNHPVTN